MYLGMDGGGTKTAFLLLDGAGQVVATHSGGSSYYPEVTIEGVRSVINTGVHAVLAQAGVTAKTIEHAFFGIPAYGEDSTEDQRLAILPSSVLRPGQYTCGNDMVCSWAGSLACEDGVSIVAGTGSIGYGEYRGRSARAGGWGELFGDEGSAYWIAREGLAAFSRMSDGREPQGALHALCQQHFQLRRPIDLAGRINNLPARERSTIARVSKVVADAALAGDAAALHIYRRAGEELAALVTAVRMSLGVPQQLSLPVSYSGGVFASGPLILDPFRAALLRDNATAELRLPALEPVAGAALYAARCHGVQFSREALARLKKSC
jgi:N-acetylglucosamine kinase-like BadF-type ATPase